MFDDLLVDGMVSGLHGVKTGRLGLWYDAYHSAIQHLTLSDRSTAPDARGKACVELSLELVFF